MKETNDNNNDFAENVHNQHISNDAYVLKDKNNSNNNVILSSDKVICRLSKLPEPKLKSELNMDLLTEEERKEIIDDHIHSKSYYNGMIRIAKKFFSVLMNSNDVKLIKFTDIVKDDKGNDACYFLEHFKKDPSVHKKEELNDLLKYFSVKNKKTVIRKADLGKKYADQCEPST